MLYDRDEKVEIEMPGGAPEVPGGALGVPGGVLEVL